MAGHAMKGYVTVPSTWRNQAAASKAWIATSLAFTRGLPPKAPGGKKAAAKKAAAKKAAAKKPSARK